MEESLGQATVSQVTNVGVTTSTMVETEVETTSTIVTTTPTSTPLWIRLQLANQMHIDSLEPYKFF